MDREPYDYEYQPELTDEEIEKIMARCNKAKPGPWKSYLEARDKMSGSDFIMTGEDDIYLIGATEDDQEFIAHCKQDVIKLVNEVRKLKILYDKVREK
jgi:hypothetical protein